MGAVLAPPANDLARGVSAYVVAVREHLAGRRDPEAVRDYLSPEEVADAYAANNPPSVLARRLSEWVASRERDGRLNGFQAARMESLVGTLVDAQGGCEKIRNTPITFNYAALIKQMLLIYLFTLPFVLVPRMGAFAPAAMAVLSFGLFGIEEAGVEVEDPFGDDPNDLPLVTITENIAKDVADLVRE
jgi:putative membrane protein